MTWSAQLKNLIKGALVILALLAAFFVAVGVLSYLQRSTCERLDAERISHLLPGHTHPGPSSVYVRPGELMRYLEAEAEMERAACEPG